MLICRLFTNGINTDMKSIYPLFLVFIVALLSACSPHSASGVWKATQDNEYGISRLVVAFDGKAEFITPKLDNAIWHCFWSAKAEKTAELKCTPSTKTDTEETFTIKINADGLAELSHKSKLIVVLTRVDENPVL